MVLVQEALSDQKEKKDRSVREEKLVVKDFKGLKGQGVSQEILELKVKKEKWDKLDSKVSKGKEDPKVY